MPVAFQTIIFGLKFDDDDQTDLAFKVIQWVGSKGIELAQSPDVVYGGDFARLRDKLKEFDQKLVGLAGGPLDRRRNFLDFLGTKEPYLYVDGLDEESKKAMEDGYTVALHPHAFMEVNGAKQAAEILNVNPHMKWLPDTAYLWIAGDDPLKSVLESPFKDCLAGIHLKDWTPVYGRASDRYARGFTEMGTGVVGLEDFVGKTKHLVDRVWFIVEQDHSIYGWVACIVKNAAWLKAAGLPFEDRSASPELESFISRSRKTNLRENESRERLQLELLFRERFAEYAEGDFSRFYDRITRRIRLDLCGVGSRSRPVPFVALLHNLEQLDGYTLAGVACESDQCHGKLPPLVSNEGLPGLDTTFRTISLADATNPLLTECRNAGADSVSVISIQNTYNAHHRRFLLIIGTAGDPRWQIGWEPLARLVATATDAYLFDACSAAAAESSFLVGSVDNTSHTREDVLNRTYKTIRKYVHAGACSIFMVRDEERLEAAFAPELKWLNVAKESGEEYYRKDDGSTMAHVWSRMESRIQVYQEARIRDNPPRSTDIPSGHTAEGKRSVIFVPIIDFPRRELLGVVRCQLREDDRGRGAQRCFSHDDVALIEAIVQPAIGALKVLEADVRRQIGLRKVRHELRNPVTAIRNNLDSLEFEVGAINLTYDYFEDCLGWCDLMGMLIERLRALDRRPEAIQPKIPRVPVALVGDILAPMTRQLRAGYRDKGIPFNQVDWKQAETARRIYVDRSMFQQIFFNLFDNSMKYCSQPSKLHVFISCEEKGDDFVIRFEDDGTGIDPHMESSIFEEGVRGHRGKLKNIEGDGFGLWIVRRLVEAHGGSVSLEKPRENTTFAIRLPIKLMETRVVVGQGKQ